MRGFSVTIASAVKTHAQPSARNGLPGFEKKKNQSPPSQMGRVRGCIVRISWAKKAMGPKGTSRPLRRMLACDCEKWKVVRTFHSRFGAEDQESDDAPHPDPEATRSRAASVGVSSIPTTIPAPKISIEYLFSMPTARQTTPNQIQSRSLPVLMMRITGTRRSSRTVARTHSSCSRLSERQNARRHQRRQSPPVPARSASPPSSRAIRAVSTTSTAPASAGKNRSAGSD